MYASMHTHDRYALSQHLIIQYMMYVMLNIKLYEMKLRVIICGYSLSFWHMPTCIFMSHLLCGVCISLLHFISHHCSSSFAATR